ncbi:MAG: molybdopterin-synthase adenylyltransferase MoeB [Pseudomonadota bacterium]
MSGCTTSPCPPVMASNSDDATLLRYSRQILLPEIGIEGQARLNRGHALIIGLGGLGSPIALYLAAAGIGRLTLADGDRVESSNLQRQIAHSEARLGELKVESARAAIAAINSHCEVHTIPQRLEGMNLATAVARVDVVLDGSDNFATRFAVNAACWSAGKPLISGAAIRFEGQVSVFPGRPGGPCYRCLYSDQGRDDETCTANGILAPIVGIVGCIQATEAIKLLTGAGETLAGRLLLFDGLRMQWRVLGLRADPGCPVCQGGRGD